MAVILSVLFIALNVFTGGDVRRILPLGILICLLVGWKHLEDQA